MQQHVAVTVGRVLFGEHDEVLSRAMGYLMNNCLSDSRAPSGFEFHKVLDLCKSSTDPLSVAKVITAGTAYEPTNAHIWLSAIESLLEDPLDERTMGKATPQFVFGLVLGLFQSQSWLDEHWPMHTTFEKRLPDVLVKLAFCFHPSTEYALDNPQNTEHPSKQYEAALSQAVKAWARPKENRNGVVGRRLAHTKDVLQASHRIFDRWGDKKEGIPKLSSLILDQIAYAHFGWISTMGRVQSLSLMHSHLLERLQRQTT